MQTTGAFYWHFFSLFGAAQLSKDENIVFDNLQIKLIDEGMIMILRIELFTCVEFEIDWLLQ